MHLSDHIPESAVELAVVFEVCRDAPESIVFGHVAPVEVSDDDSLLRVERFQFLEMRELLDRVDQLVVNEVHERLLRPLSAVFALQLLSVADDFQRWILANLEAGRDGRLLIAVHLSHHHLTGRAELAHNLVGGLIENRLQQIAEPAPVSVEVDKD